MSNEQSSIGDFPLGTLQEQLYSLFVDPKSLWSAVKQDAFSYIIDDHVSKVITSEEQRLKIVVSFFEAKLLDDAADAFSEIQDFALKISRREPYYISDLRKVIEHLTEIVSRLKNTYAKYLGMNGQNSISGLMYICEYLCRQVEKKIDCTQGR